MDEDLALHMAIARASRNPFFIATIEHSLAPKTQADVAAWFGSVPAVPAACKGQELLGDGGCAANGYDLFDKIHFWKTPIKDCGEGRTCVDYKTWTEAFNGIQSGQ